MKIAEKLPKNQQSSGRRRHSMMQYILVEYFSSPLKEAISVKNDVEFLVSLARKDQEEGFCKTRREGRVRKSS